MSITQGLHRSRQATPDKLATVCGERSCTFRQQHERVSRLAGALRAIGLAPRDRLAVVSLNSDRFLDVLLAAAWAGLAFAPQNTRWTSAEIAYVINDVGARALVIDDTFAPLVPELRTLCPDVADFLFIGDGDLPEGALSVEGLISVTEPVADVQAADTDLAGVFYTGGTTGHPKGVMLSHGNLMTAALGALATGDFLESQPTVAHAAPLFHLAGIWPWVSGMLLGGTHVAIPAFDPDGVIRTINRHQVTDVLLVPTMIQFTVTRLRESGEQLPTLRHLIYAGSPMSEALLDATEQALPDVRLVQAYGMTELAPVATMLGPADHAGDKRRSAGRAAPHALVAIVDPDGREVASGTVGEIAVRGSYVMMGYWNQPQVSEAALRGGWMHTGDAGYMDQDGYVYVVDRIKDMIITGGENVYSAEVENALATHSAVATCAVIGVQDEQWGERVHAVVVLAPGAQGPTLDEVRDHVGSRIARYKAPRSVEYVAALPISAAGKILKRELRAAHVTG